MTDDNEDEGVRHDISASAIKTHDRCPEQYRLRYVERKPGDDINKWNVVGSLIHDSIEAVLKEDPDFTNKNRLARHLKKEFYDREDTDDYDMSIVDDDLREDGLGCMDMAAAWLCQKQPEIRGLEVKSYFELSELKQTALAYMDVCTSNELWDWKTGRVPDDDDEEKKRGLLIQGAFYMGAYYKEYGELPEKIRFIFLKEGEVKSFDASEDNWELMMKYARRLVSDERTGQFRAKPSRDKCHWCSYEQFCHASPTSIRQLQQEIDEGNVELWEAI